MDDRGKNSKHGVILGRREACCKASVLLLRELCGAARAALLMRTKLADANIQEIINFITMDDDLVLNIATEPEIPARKGGFGGKGGRWTERCVT